MLQQELQALRERLSHLEGKVDTVERRADFDRTQILKFVQDRLKEVDHLLWPAFTKLFPNFAKSASEIDKIIKWSPERTGHQIDLPNGKKII